MKSSKSVKERINVYIHITNTNFNLYATQSTGKGINYRGDVAFGNKDDVTDHDVNIYGDLIMHNNLRIKEGYNLIVESGNSFTQLETEVQVTDILQITNQVLVQLQAECLVKLEKF